MIRAIIIDDEKNIRNRINNKLNQFFNDEVNVIAEASNVKEGTIIINNYQPDLLFLDIELTDGTSFDILNKINYNNFQIIFITGFNDHAIKAIKVGALDYILKPIDDDEFINATQKALLKLNTKNYTKNLSVSDHFYNGHKEKKIVLKTLKEHYIVNENDILYCKSEGMYTTFYFLEESKVIISKPLKFVEELLSKESFIKSHQSYIVNKKYIKLFNTDGFLVLTNDSKIPVASRRKDFVLKQI